MSAKTIEKKVNAVWKHICTKNLIPRHVEKNFISSNTDLPRFYHLIKTHKVTETLKIRPIISNVNGPTKRISWLMAHLLHLLLANVPAHLKSSLQLIHRIQTNNSDANREFPYPFSLNVVALYTSIPVNEAIENISNIMGHSINHFSRNDHIVQLLTVITSNVYFTFDSDIFLQIKGLPMGSSVSGILAILFMDTLEKKAVTSCRYISQYSRYVDDIYSQTTDEQQAENFLHIMNELHPQIKFEIEKPKYTTEGYSLSLLDFTVKI